MAETKSDGGNTAEKGPGEDLRMRIQRRRDEAVVRVRALFYAGYKEDQGGGGGRTVHGAPLAQKTELEVSSASTAQRRDHAPFAMGATPSPRESTWKDARRRRGPLKGSILNVRRDRRVGSCF